MKVCIIGWYGSETLGDRAILAGILAFLSEAFDDLHVSLGSLFPFFSERTVSEDADLWKTLTDQTIALELFDSTRKGALERAIRNADLLLLGGGPLMDLRDMQLLAYGFRYARRKRVKTGVFGCGIGPLKQNASRKAAAEILSTADFAVFRDSLAEKAAADLCGGRQINSSCAIDPAAYCAVLYKQSKPLPDRTRSISINLRKIFQEYGEEGLGTRFEDFAAELVKRITDANADHKIYLVPNHYFVVGRDDRSFLNQVKYRLHNREIRVQNRPLSLRETMDMYGSSACCVGMRFHAVVLMAILNGRCRVVNYTGSQAGKIAGFMADFDRQRYFGRGRMVALDAEEWNLSAFDNMTTDGVFVPDAERLDGAFDTYRQVLAGCLN